MISIYFLMTILSCLTLAASPVSAEYTFGNPKQMGNGCLKDQGEFLKKTAVGFELVHNLNLSENNKARTTCNYVIPIKTDAKQSYHIELSPVTGAAQITEALKAKAAVEIFQVGLNPKIKAEGEISVAKGPKKSFTIIPDSDSKPSDKLTIVCSSDSLLRINSSLFANGAVKGSIQLDSLKIRMIAHPCP